MSEKKRKFFVAKVKQAIFWKLVAVKRKNQEIIHKSAAPVPVSDPWGGKELKENAISFGLTSNY